MPHREGLARKWAIADIYLSSGRRVYIFEVQKSYRDISMLIILRPNNEPKYAAEQALEIIKKRQGSFSKSDLLECYKSNYQLLPHHNGRSFSRWAELIWQKISTNFESILIF